MNAHDVIVYPTASNLQPFHSSQLRYRQASAGDATVLAQLIYAAGEAEFAYFLGADSQTCIAFLQEALEEPLGHFSWHHHQVATLADQPVAVMSIQDGRGSLLNGPYLAAQLTRHFGWRQTGAILRRGLVLQREIPSPARDQTLIAHCATVPEMRGLGVFSALFSHAMTCGQLPARKGQDIILDVLASNTQAFALYRRLGFVQMSTHPFVAAGVPEHLFAKRMRFRATPRSC